jgi:hypothetical protein
MSRLRSLRPSASMAVALLALFVALGGSVYAAAKINGSAVKKNSLPGNRIKPGSVTGKQVREASLGKVPDADTLDGIDSSQLSAIDSTGLASVARDGHGDDAIGTGSGGAGTAAEVTINAPRNGTVLAIASGAVQNLADSDIYKCILNLDGVDQGPSRRGGELHFEEILAGGVNEQICATNAAATVPQGPHTVQFNFSDLDNTTAVDEAELDVVFIPLSG